MKQLNRAVPLMLNTLALLFVIGVVPKPVEAQFPVGDPFVVNTTTTGGQYSPDVAAGRNGSFAVVWSSMDQDGSGWGIFARWFDFDGTPLTPEVPVNVFTDGNQVRARIDGDDQGRYVIVWEDQARGILARRFDDLGQALSGELEVAASVNATEGTVSVNAGGAFVVAWLRTAQPHDFVKARRYSADGLAIGDALIVETFNRETGEEETAVEVCDDGSFLVAWTDNSEVFGRRYGPTGDPVGGRVQISQLDPLSFRAMRLDAGSDVAGDYRIFWATDINLEEVVSMTRTMSAAGSLGPLTNLGHPTNKLPGFSMTGNGDFIITHYFDTMNLEGTRFDSDHQILSDFVVAESPGYYTSRLRLAHRGPDSRELVAVWAQATTIHIEWDIRARLFTAGVFVDGFESGDTSAWSND